MIDTVKVEGFIVKEPLFDEPPGERAVNRLRHLPLERDGQRLAAQFIISEPLRKVPLRQRAVVSLLMSK